MIKPAVVSLLSMIVMACGGGSGGDGGGSSVVDLGISASADANQGTSYTNASRPDVWINYSSLTLPGSANLRDAIAYLDADQDGKTDIFMASGKFQSQTELTPGSMLYLNSGNDTTFAASASSFQNSSAPPASHSRKSIVADFNGDGLDDIFIFDHGYDANPYPGEQPKLVMQQSAGLFSWSKLPEVGFFHGGAAADIDNDGDMDIFVGGFSPFFYINDGNGNFTRKTDRFDGSINKVFSAELIDVDEDGYVDLLVGAHERDGDKTSIYWGSTSGSYSSVKRTVIPTVQYFGAILDFDAEDIDNDGDRDLLINRTRDGDDGPAKGFYMGRSLQLLVNTGNHNLIDETATRIAQPGGDADNWFPWLRVQDADGDGDLDLASDDMGDGVAYLNDGAGSFIKQ